MPRPKLYKNKTRLQIVMEQDELDQMKSIVKLFYGSEMTMSRFAVKAMRDYLVHPGTANSLSNLYTVDTEPSESYSAECIEPD